MFSRATTLGIFLVLALPEVLRHAAGRLEPYPAAVLPVGARTVRVRDGVATPTVIVLLGQRGSEWIELDMARFFDPLPAHYVPGIVHNEFGMASSVARRNVVAGTQRWLKDRLHKQGFDAKRFRVEYRAVAFQLSSLSPSSFQVVRRKTYELD
jgi:hypothetical protein